MKQDDNIYSKININKQETKNGYNSNPLNSYDVPENIKNSLQTHPKINRMYGGYNSYFRPDFNVFNYQETVSYIVEILKNKKDINEIFYAFHNIFVNKMNCFYSALGVFNKETDCLNLKLISNVGSTYSSKVFLKEDSNPLIQTFLNKKKVIKLENSFLNIPYLTQSQCIIIPIIVQEEVLGVLLLGDNSSEVHTEFYELLSCFLGLCLQNEELMQNNSLSSSIDALTGLHSHRKFQEILTQELKRTECNSENMAIVILDIVNISNINKEFGHAKGDEIIKKVAQIVKNNLRKQDFAGRYGGDEIAIILPNTSVEEAKYLAEYFSYLLSCTTIDGVGTIKVSIGIATYPQSSLEQEKLLILAEQAMYISMSKGYQNGISTIVCSEDFDFWDDVALHSFASVVMKRHSQIGINLDEELINKFNSAEIKSQNHLIEVVTSLATAIDAKDSYTKGHSSSVSRYAEALARALNMPEKEVERIKLGGLLHDIGKIGIPENVLRKPTHLSDEEWEIMKQHPTIGTEKVLLPNPSLHDLIPMVKSHHEHWDGTGYPEGLKGEEIAFEARIVAIADAYHALISDRPYRKGLSIKKACEILQLGANIQWDGNLVRKFITIAPSLGTQY